MSVPREVSIFKAIPIAVRQAWLNKTSNSDTTEQYRNYAMSLDQPDKVAWFHDDLSGELLAGNGALVVKLSTEEEDRNGSLTPFVFCDLLRR